jgi:hypothetical protein
MNVDQGNIMAQVIALATPLGDLPSLLSLGFAEIGIDDVSCCSIMCFSSVAYIPLCFTGMAGDDPSLSSCPPRTLASCQEPCASNYAPCVPCTSILLS